MHSNPLSICTRRARPWARLFATVAVATGLLVQPFAGRAWAQHGGHGDERGHADVEAHEAASPEHAELMMGPLGIPRSRHGSGTSWLPDSSPMYGLMWGLGDGGLMLHANVFMGYDWFGSERGSDRFMSTNWLMAMAWHPVGPGELTARVMLSAEPWTVGDEGYPLILQSGETADGEPLHDRQHPHDLFMELALMYVLPVSREVGVELYAAASGEPALGPTAFPHRVSAMSDPFAPLGHHWQDSTHIAFPVFTVGVFTRHLKLDASWFNGREPDEQRWDLDLRAPDSWSGRITWNPDERWSFQGSYGFLESPEVLEPDVSVQRVAASATFNRRRGQEANWASTFVYGQNIPSEGPTTPSLLLETSWNMRERHVLYGRAEYVQKTGHDLVLPEPLEHEIFHTGLLGLGYNYHFGPFASFTPALGVRGTMGVMGDDLQPFYGQRLPLGVMVYLQLRPAAMPM
jgi:hypothetical protein